METISHCTSVRAQPAADTFSGTTDEPLQECSASMGLMTGRPEFPTAPTVLPLSASRRAGRPWRSAPGAVGAAEPAVPGACTGPSIPDAAAVSTTPLTLTSLVAS